MRTTFLCCFLAAAVALSTPSAAEPAPAPNADNATDGARKLHIEGDSHYERGEYEKACIAYLGAWKLKKHYQIAGNLGDCEMRLGKHRDAAEHLAYFLREYPVDKPTNRFEKGKQLFEQARSKIGTIYVTVNAPKAKILVDGEVIGESPLEEPLFLAPGDRLIEARSGHDRVMARLTITPGFTRRQDLKLPKPPIAPIRAAAKPAVKAAVAPASSAKEQPPSLVLPGILGASAVLAGGVGVASWVLSNVNHDKQYELTAGSLEYACRKDTAAPARIASLSEEQCAAIATSDADRRTFRSVYIGAFSVSGAAAAGAVATLIWSQTSRKEPPVEAAPAVSSNGFAVVVRGRF